MTFSTGNPEMGENRGMMAGGAAESLPLQDKKLPPVFIERMRRILGSEYGQFEESYQREKHQGLRVNTLKITPSQFLEKVPFSLEPVPWISSGFICRPEDGCSRHPYYQAGLYYLQEPSAMLPAQLLDVQPGHRVLDMCAAPGGKATALAEKLQGEGVLVANDINAGRCKALLKNLELFGARNILVTNAVPVRLAQRFQGWFDRVLLDAPCSGEGMFRKDDTAIRTWSEGKVEECSKIQKNLVLLAADMLRPGGKMLYSTCTFEVDENEGTIAYLLENRPDMHLVPIDKMDGFADGLNGYDECLRLWPHKVDGEGHFMALLEKDPAGAEDALVWGKSPEDTPVTDPGRGELRETADAGSGYKERKRNADRSLGRKASKRNVADTQAALDFARRAGIEAEKASIVCQGDSALMLPDVLLPPLDGIAYLRRGLLLGEIRKDRFEPSQALAMTLRSEDYPSCVSLPPEDEMITRYLRGETLTPGEEVLENTEGWTLLCADRYPLGWVRRTGNLLKNKYLQGWRQSS